jgi:hypothetical protein
VLVRLQRLELLEHHSALLVRALLVELGLEAEHAVGHAAVRGCELAVTRCEVTQLHAPEVDLPAFYPVQTRSSLIMQLFQHAAGPRCNHCRFRRQSMRVLLIRG